MSILVPWNIHRSEVGSEPKFSPTPPYEVTLVNVLIMEKPLRWGSGKARVKVSLQRNSLTYVRDPSGSLGPPGSAEWPGVHCRQAQGDPGLRFLSSLCPACCVGIRLDRTLVTSRTRKQSPRQWAVLITEQVKQSSRTARSWCAPTTRLTEALRRRPCELNKSLPTGHKMPSGPRPSNTTSR